MIALKYTTSGTSFKATINSRRIRMSEIFHKEIEGAIGEFEKQFKFIVGGTRYDRSGQRVAKRTGKFYNSIAFVNSRTPYTSTSQVKIVGEHGKNIFKWLTEGTEPHYITGNENQKLKIPRGRIRNASLLASLGRKMFYYADIVFHPGQESRDLVNMSVERSSFQRKIDGIRRKLENLQ